MSEVAAEGRKQFLQKITDAHFLFLYATRLARLANFRRLKAPTEIIANEQILTDEIVAERKNRPYSSAELYIAVGDELKKLTRKRRAS